VRRWRRAPSARVLAAAALAAAVAGAAYWAATRGASTPAEPIDVIAEAERRLGIDLHSARIPTNGIRLHVVEAGPGDGPPVVLLHGMPEFWWGWAGQIARLARAGFRVIAPDQRGYNLSDKPPRVEAYRMAYLAQDVVGLIEELGYESVYLAGHDWGGIVAFQVAVRRPAAVRKLVVFNSFHPFALEEASRRPEDGEDTITWYRVMFQLPWIPELVTPLGGWAFFVKMLRDTSREGTFPDEELAYYRQAWSREGAIRSMLHWYRAYADFRFPG
jgi:pimeloyl-ACP methyl ester carboxylesterase